MGDFKIQNITGDLKRQLDKSKSLRDQADELDKTIEEKYKPMLMGLMYKMVKRYYDKYPEGDEFGTMKNRFEEENDIGYDNIKFIQDPHHRFLIGDDTIPNHVWFHDLIIRNGEVMVDLRFYFNDDSYDDGIELSACKLSEIFEIFNLLINVPEIRGYLSYETMVDINEIKKYSEFKNGE